MEDVSGYLMEIAGFLIINFLRILIIFKYIKFFLGREKRKRMSALLIMLYFVLNSVFYYVIKNEYANLLVNVMLMFILTLNFSISIYKRLMAVIFTYGMNIFLEMIVYQTFVLHIEEDAINPPLIITALLLLFVIAVLEKGRMFREKEIVNLKQWGSSILIVLISILLTIVFLNYTVYSSVGILASVGVLAINLIMFWLFDSLEVMYAKQEENVILRMQSQAYEKELELINHNNLNLKIVRHDMANHLYRLEGFAERNDMNMIKKYLSSMREAKQESEALVDSGNANVDSLLNYKLAAAKRLGAQIKAEIKIPENLGIPSYDLDALLGNALDNALNAIEKGEDPFLYVNMSYYKNYLSIILKNSINEEVKIAKDGTLVTTRENKEEHGIGMKSMQKIVKKYDGNMTFKVEDNQFMLSILLLLE